MPGEELWDPEFKRLTMTLDPGRIKRGLTSNETLGPPLTEGKRYTLVIDASWPDARGVPMVEGSRKRSAADPRNAFRPILAVDRDRAEGGHMRCRNSRFPTPMNYPLLQRMIRVSGPRGILNGTVEIARQETEWRFVPQQPWATRRLPAHCGYGARRRAGNHIGEPFDVDVFNKVTEHIETRTISRGFNVR